jgi:hypothetical protein
MTYIFGHTMKVFALLIIVICTMTGILSAQNDPFGDLDTLSLDQLTIGAGEIFSMNVNLWNGPN